MDVRLNAPATAIEACGDGYRVHFCGPSGEDALDADLVVHAAGRVPKTRELDLGTAKVRTDAVGAVEVNEYLQSVSNPRVYAAGDATLPPGSLPLTPVGAYEGLVVASNLLHGNQTKPDYRGIPSVVFTIPPLAGVGPTEAEARALQIDIRVRMEDPSQWYSNRRVNQSCAMFKTIVETGSDRVCRRAPPGPYAEEVINLFALAIRRGLAATDLKHQIYAYPTSGSEVPYML